LPPHKGEGNEGDPFKGGVKSDIDRGDKDGEKSRDETDDLELGRTSSLVAKLVWVVSDMIVDENGASPSSSSTHGAPHHGLQKMWWGNVFTCWMSWMGDSLSTSEANLCIRIL
jgi:hypothetical protein